MRATATPALCGLSRLQEQPLPPARDRRCRGDTSHPRAATLFDERTATFCVTRVTRVAAARATPGDRQNCGISNQVLLVLAPIITRSLTGEGSTEAFKAKFSRWSHYNRHAPSLSTLPNIVG